MCVYSMIVDHFNDKWTKKLEESDSLPAWPTQGWLPPPSPPQLTDEEIADLRKLLERAKEYDARTGQKECELEEKKEKLRRLAAELGAKVEFV